jgi:hypothetical protein
LVHYCEIKNEWDKTATTVNAQGENWNNMAESRNLETKRDQVRKVPIEYGEEDAKHTLPK